MAHSPGPCLPVEQGLGFQPDGGTAALGRREVGDPRELVDGCSPVQHGGGAQDLATGEPGAGGPLGDEGGEITVARSPRSFGEEQRMPSGALPLGVAETGRVDVVRGEGTERHPLERREPAGQLQELLRRMIGRDLPIPDGGDDAEPVTLQPAQDHGQDHQARAVRPLQVVDEHGHGHVPQQPLGHGGGERRLRGGWDVARGARFG